MTDRRTGVLGMRGVVRPLYLLVLFQGVCLGAGLWIHDRFLISTSQWDSRETSLTRTAEPVEPGAALAAAKVQSLGSTSEIPRTAIRMEDVRGHKIIQGMPTAAVIAFVWTWGLQSVVAYFLLSRVQVEHSQRVSRSDEQSLQNTRDLIRTRDAVIFGLAKLAESRDRDTGQHLERISLYSTRIASALSKDPRYQGIVTPAFVRLIGISSALHDIGKVGVEDSVLLKPGILTAGERFRMQLHAQVGAECIREIERRLGTSNFLEMAREIAYSHHERWDGAGYPEGISGEAIPLAARIVAIADVYDALAVRRVYKKSIPHEKCVEIIREEAGRQFDPSVVRVFLEIESQFKEIARRHADEPTTEPAEFTHLEQHHQFTPEEQQALLDAIAECNSVASKDEVIGVS
ncbi:MAG: HD-GYP domain-containing protein [Planctomycetaceae bacterium]